LGRDRDGYRVVLGGVIFVYEIKRGDGECLVFKFVFVFSKAVLLLPLLLWLQ